jgi:hypothetical protein
MDAGTAAPKAETAFHIGGVAYLDEKAIGINRGQPVASGPETFVVTFAIKT